MSDLTISMFNFAAKAQKEAIAVRIITVVTLLYLPATFVSVGVALIASLPSFDIFQTFFSTDVVKYQSQTGTSNDTVLNQPNSTSFSSLAMERWLEVTLPLTVLTLGAAIYFFNRYVRKAKEEVGAALNLPMFYKTTLGP